MSRLYLILIYIFIGCSVFGQSDLKRYLEFAKEKYEKGDYIYAIDYYEKAMQYDSSTIDILWDYAQALRAYKDYSKAEFYYGKVFEREGGELYPKSLLYYGLMLKHNQKYDKAVEIFKRGKKLYRSDRRGYLYRKTRNEISSCIWARSNIGDSTNLIFEQLPETVNTPDAEFGHRVFNNKLLYSSLRADSLGNKEEVYDPSYSTHLYTSKIQDSTYKKGEAVEDLFWEKHSVGNGTFSLDSNRFYFSFCESSGYNYKCKILVAYFENEKFVDIDTLGPIINEPGYNTTMPFIGEWDGDEVLFYASDRFDGKGGMDIWYSFIKNGNQFKRPQNPKRLNSMDNELSPFWDAETKTLYFSSTWNDGFGGYDVFKSQYQQSGFEGAKNMMEPINSSANDLYYFQTTSGDTAYFSSNRLGVNYSKNPTCCSDIFLVREELDPEPPTIEETLEDLNKRLPVTLYFHNDIPNPNSWDTTTNVNYINAYKDYIAMLDKYKQEYSEGLKGDDAEDARDDIEDFFVEYVEQGVKDLELFRNLLLETLEKGRKIQITVKGFASPLAKTDYNVNLTKRRIASLVNYLYEYNDGVFQSFLDDEAENGGKVTFAQVPFGEYEADQITSDNPNDVKNSVYSRAAAIERKIEIQSVDVIREEDTQTTILTAQKQVVDLGEVKEGSVLDAQFTVRNTGDRPISIEEIRIPCECIKAETEIESLEPNEEGVVNVTFDTSGYSGHEVKSVYIKYSGAKEELRLVVTTEVK
jgi:tetratricopeptide (TPR) repeat protein